MSERASFWVVLRTQLRREWIAAQSVGACGVEAYVPQMPAQIDPPRRSLVFPGYLFARVAPNADDLLRIRSVPGIAYVLPRGGAPAEVADDVIQLLRRRERASPRPFEHGERVLILAEPFRSLDAIFDRRLSAAGRVRVLVEMVHRAVALETQESTLRRANDYGALIAQ